MIPPDAPLLHSTPSPTDDQAVLGSFLSGRDAPCPICTYNLRDSASNRCPECGARLELRIGSDDLRIGPWLAALLSALAPAAYGFFAVLILVTGSIVWGYPGHQAAVYVGIVCAAGALGLVVAVTLIRQRRRFWRLPRRRQHFAALGIASIAAAAMTAVIMIIFVL
jgi:hypothetical protein